MRKLRCSGLIFFFRWLQFLVFGGTGIFWSVDAIAAGFQVRTGSPDWIANAFAGMAAKGYDASTAWTNPAAMTLLQDSELASGLNGIFPDTKFTGQNLFGTSPTPGNNGGQPSIASPTASFAGVWSATPDLRLGFSLESPFGQRLQYSSDFVGRYQALKSSVTDIELGLVAGYRVDEHLSIGGGPIVDYFQARLTSAINTGPTAALTGDPTADVHGNNWSAGLHLGGLYEFDPDLRAGLDYRSRISEPIDGGQSIFIPGLISALSPTVANQLAAGNTHIHTSATLPDVLTLSGLWDVTSEWTALATLQWTDWSLLKQLLIVGDNGQTTTQPLNFRDTWMGSVGANYRPAYMTGLMLQVGVGYDQSVATDSTRTPRLPGQDIVILGMGFTYDVLQNASLQFAFLHDFGVGPHNIDYSSGPTAGTLIGSYQTSTNVISLGVNWRF